MCHWENGWLEVIIRVKKKKRQVRTGTDDFHLTLTARRLICIVQTVRVSITFEAFSDTVTTATLEVTRMARP